MILCLVELPGTDTENKEENSLDYLVWKQTL